MCIHKIEKYMNMSKFFYSPTIAQVIVLKTLSKFTLKLLRHVSVQSHHNGVTAPKACWSNFNVNLIFFKTKTCAFVGE